MEVLTVIGNASGTLTLYYLAALCISGGMAFTGKLSHAITKRVAVIVTALCFATMVINDFFADVNDNHGLVAMIAASVFLLPKKQPAPGVEQTD